MADLYLFWKRGMESSRSAPGTPCCILYVAKAAATVGKVNTLFGRTNHLKYNEAWRSV